MEELTAAEIEALLNAIRTEVDNYEDCEEVEDALYRATLESAARKLARM